MGGQGVEVELLAQVLEEVLLRPARELGAATWSKGSCGWVVITGTWRPLARRRRIWRTVSPLRSTIGFSARSTVAALVPAGPWISTSSLWKSSSGQSSPRSGLQPARSNTRVSAGAPASGWVRGAASGATSCSSASGAGALALVSGRAGPPCTVEARARRAVDNAPRSHGVGVAAEVTTRTPDSTQPALRHGARLILCVRLRR